jgi:hypothetical protein
MPDQEMQLSHFERQRLEELRLIKGFQSEQQAAEWVLKQVLNGLPPLACLLTDSEKVKRT